MKNYSAAVKHVSSDVMGILKSHGLHCAQYGGCLFNRYDRKLMSSVYDSRAFNKHPINAHLSYVFELRLENHSYLLHIGRKATEKEFREICNNIEEPKFSITGPAFNYEYQSNHRRNRVPDDRNRVPDFRDITVPFELVEDFIEQLKKPHTDVKKYLGRIAARKGELWVVDWSKIL